MRKQTLHKTILLVVGLVSLGLLLFISKPASAANPTTMNFQGKVVNSNGTNVTDGTYSFIFRIYNTASPTMTSSCTSTASCLWQETQASVTVTNGVFQIELGASCALTSSSCNNSTGGPINFATTSSLYLTMQFNGDTSGANGGYMSPTIHLTSVPFAFNSDQLGGLNATNFVQLAQGVQTDASTTNPSIYINKANVSGSPNILQLQKSGSDVLVVNNSGDLIVGKAGTGGINGKIVFNTTNASNTTITLVAASTGTSYSLTLPTTGPSTSQCLQSDSVTASQLVFGSCSVGGGATSLDDAYNQSSNTGNAIVLTAAGDGVLIQDAASTVGGNLFAVQKSGGTLSYLGVTTTGINIQSNATGSAVNALAFDTSSTTPHLKIFGSDGVKYADIYYDNATSTAYFGASTGTSVLGSGTGGVDILAGPAASFNITGNANSTITTAAGNLAIESYDDLTLASTTGDVMIDAAGSGVLYLSANTTDLIGNTSFAISTTGSNDLTLATSTGNINIGTSTDKDITIGNTASNTNVFITGGTGVNNAIVLSSSGSGGITIDSGTTGNLNFGTGSNSKAIAIGNSQTGTTITGTAGGTVQTLSNSGAIIKTNTNSVTAFQVQNSSGTKILDINTLTTALNLVSNSSFEQNINGWSAKATPTGGTPLWDNTASNSNFGSSTLKLSTDAAADGASYAYHFKASTQYSLSLYAKISAATQGFTIGRQDNGSDVDTGCTNGTNSITITTSYQQFTCTFTTGATIAATSNIYLKQSGAGTPTIYIDGFTLVESSTAQAYVSPADNIQVDAKYSNIILNSSQNPDLQPWQLSGNAITTARRGAATVTSNGYIYFIGGTTATGAAGAPVTTINFAKLNSDGSTGAWSTSGITALPVALYGHASFISNGYLYVIGGCTDSSVTAACTAAASTVYYSKLNGDGTNGTWQTNAFALGVPAGAAAARGFGSAVSVGGFVYFTGGYTGAAASATSFSGKLNADGSISGWVTSGVTALSAARYGHTLIAANGNLYSVGGCTDAAGTCGTAITTVEWATSTIAGAVGSWTATTSLTTATGFHSAAILNGHLYVFGGRQSAAAVSGVVYSKFSGANSLGIWTAGTSLPVARQQAAWVWANNYAYVLGGFDGTATLPTSALYASGARVSIFGGLDLVGLTGQGLGDYGGGGTLTAGNTRVVGDLRVEGFADFNNGISVDSGLNINAVSATAGQSVFNINNSSSNSIFSIRHMAANFGALVKAGAFEGRNSYFGEEFNVGKLATCAPTGAAGNSLNFLARGDYGGQGATANCSATAATTVNGGQMSASIVGAGTGTFGSCSFASPGVTTINGVERITATSVNTANSSANCVENLAGTTTTSNKILLAANLPVVSMKVRASTLTASTAAQRIQLGMVSSDSANTLGVNSPTQSIYFTNCSTWNNAAVPTGCSNTTWYGVTSTTGASAATVVTCSTGAGVANGLTLAFSYLRIEVRSTTDVHFFADYNASDGINESECGTGSATNITSSAMTPWLGAMYNAQAAASTAVEIDYYRSWQDDNVSLPQEAVTQAPNGEEFITEAPLTIDSVSDDPGSFFSFNAAASEDTVFNKDVYIKGTLFANKIKANQIEGLELFTGKISGLRNSVANAVSPTVSAETPVVPLDLNVLGGLTVGGPSEFKGNAFFRGLVTFVEKSVFNNDVTFAAHVTTSGETPKITLEPAAGLKTKPEDNPDAKLASTTIKGNDVSGQITLTAGDNAAAGELVTIEFKKSYPGSPQVFLTPTNSYSGQLKYYVVSTADSFRLALSESPTPGEKIQFNYWVIH